MKKTLISFFASPERASNDIVNGDFQKLIQAENIEKLLDSTLNFAAILNVHRQIVFLNQSLLSFLRIEDIEKVIGSRPGEAINCIHCWDCDSGCGTSKNCSNCGAVQAIIESQDKNIQVTKECRITTIQNNEEVSLDLSVTATPFNLDKDKFTILLISDISDQKRKRILERIFFHDVMNTASSIYGFMRFIGQLEEIKKIKEFVPMVENASSTLIDQIQEQRQLMMAENGEYEIELEP